MSSREERKALIREYKRTPKEMGVYIIRNTANDKCFVAASRDIKARLNRHRMCLGNGLETIAGLQQDWNFFGAAAFEFDTLDALEPATTPGYDPGQDLAVLEALWLEKLQPFEPAGYVKAGRIKVR